MEKKHQRALLAASVAGLVAAWGIVQAQAAEENADGPVSDKVPCYGINKCQGTGDCGGVGHSCHGNNTCQGQGYIDLNQDDCLRIQGGRLTEEG